MRRLVIAEVIVIALIGVLLLASQATFAYYRLGWLAHALIAALVFVLAWRRAYWRLIGLSALALPAALITLPPHFGALDLILVLWTLGALPLISAGLVGRPIEPPALPLPRALLIVGIAAGCVVSLRSIHAFPNFSATDEAIITSYVDTFQRGGRIENSLIPNDAPTITGSLYVYAASLWAKLFPADPFALRYLSALGGIALIVVVFLVARALHDTLTGWIAMALLATNLLWIAVSHVGRQEIWLAVFVWAAFWLSLEARKRQSLWLALLAGTVVALSADVHPLGAYACLALGVWWVAPLTNRKRGLLFAFVIGGVIGAAYFVFVHVLPDPGRFLAALRSEAVGNGAEGWTPLAAMAARHASYLAANPLEVALLLIGSLAALRHVRRLGVFIGALLLLYAFTVADPNLYYPILWITGMVILAAVGLRRAAWRWRAPLLVGFLAAFVLNVVLIERHMRDDWNARSLDAIRQVAARVPLDTRGMGESFLYLALRETQPTGDARFTGFTFVNFGAADAGISTWEVIETIRPDWIVTMQDEAAFTPEFSILSVGRAAHAPGTSQRGAGAGVSFA